MKFVVAGQATRIIRELKYYAEGLNSYWSATNKN